MNKFVTSKKIEAKKDTGKSMEKKDTEKGHRKRKTPKKDTEKDAE